MDFMSRGGRQAAHTSNQAPAGSHSSDDGGYQSSGKSTSGSMRIAIVVLLFSVTILLASIGIYLGTSSTGRYNESILVEDAKYQAVFLNGGQVYFGKIKVLNKSFVVVEDIYYLRVNQQIQPGQEQNTQNPDISLAKLGNELHGPQDRMVINREQVMFWENLKDDGQVVKAITDYKVNGGASSNQTQGSANTSSPRPQTNSTEDGDN